MDFYIGFGIYVDENSWLADKLVLGRFNSYCCLFVEYR